MQLQPTFEKVNVRGFSSHHQCANTTHLWECIVWDEDINDGQGPGRARHQGMVAVVAGGGEGGAGLRAGMDGDGGVVGEGGEEEEEKQDVSEHWDFFGALFNTIRGWLGKEGARDWPWSDQLILGSITPKQSMTQSTRRHVLGNFYKRTGTTHGLKNKKWSSLRQFLSTESH